MRETMPQAMMQAIARHPLRTAVAVMLPFLVFPAIDLTVSGWFYRPDGGFYLRGLPAFQFVLKGLPVVLIGLAAAVAILGLAGELLGRRLCGVTRRLAAYVVGSLALGPGLLVNVLLKDHWGRARPSQIAQFGGSAHFTPPLMLADQCRTNCSFSSGHGALGFWVVAFALLAPPRWRPQAVIAALLFGSVVGVVRIAQGGHFLSDVVFSAVLVISLTAWLKRVLLPE